MTIQEHLEKMHDLARQGAELYGLETLIIGRYDDPIEGEQLVRIGMEDVNAATDLKTELICM